MSSDPSSHAGSRALVRDASRRSISSIPFQDLSIRNSPSRDHLSPPPSATQSSFRIRSSLTPQPSRASFGPSTERHDHYDRNESAPPSFTNLNTKPVFVRPPPERTSNSVRPFATLGSVVGTHRKTSLTRQETGDQSDQPSGSVHGPAQYVSPAERALHELDLYKTPLLPSRLRGSSTLPIIIGQPKMSKIIMLQEEEKARLGKKRSKSKHNEKKPYAGEGGMKKMLGKRKQEEQDRMDEAENDSSLMEEEAPKKASHSKSFSAHNNSPELSRLQDKLNEPEPSYSTQHDRGTTFRVGRAKSNRNHAPSVTLSRPSKNRFSAAEEEPEDDEERVALRRMLDEAAKNAPVFNIPTGFSFATDKEVLQGSSNANAKEPPIGSLPFSFGKPATPPTIGSAAPSSFPSDERASAAIGSMPTSSFVSSALGTTSSTEQSKPVEVPVSAFAPPSTGVPNFFANTTAFKAPLNVPVSAGSFSPSSSVLTPAEPSSAGQAPVSDIPSFFQRPERSSQNSASAFSAPLSDIMSEAPSTNGTTNGDSSSFQLPPPIASTEAKISFPSFTQSSVTAEPPKPQEPSPFSAPASQSTPAPVETPSSNPFGGFSSSASTQPAFGWGGSTTGTDSVKTAVETNDKPAHKPAFSFGSTPATTPAAAPSPGFPFGQPSKPSAETTPASTRFPVSQPSNGSAAPSSQGGFTFGASSNSTASPFGSAPSEVKSTPFSFGAPSQAAPAPLFGTSAPTSDPKPFSFGQSGNATMPTTPPKSQDDLRMDESPTRDISDVPGNKPSMSFGFGSSGSSGFGSNGAQPSESPGFSFGGTPSSGFGSTDNRPGSTGSQSTGFSFGQPASKPSLSFGAPTPAHETPRPSTTGSFSFGGVGGGGGFSNGGQQPSQGSPFAFGSPKTEPSNSFGQQQQLGSAPSSPATFNNPAPFAFGSNTSQPQSANPFSFGSSQPASPATPNSALPQTGGGFGGFGGAPSTPAGSGGSLFNIGAPPPAGTATPGGGRNIRKLPSRRTTSKR